MPRKLGKTQKQTIWIDDRGRLTIPSYLLEAAGIKKPGWVEIEANPSLEECESLFIKKT
jgi:bifunctional DNA-binding transcriptional regulator/antitoxin component of YhaV-PrlF toxin-antitoxin module